MNPDQYRDRRRANGQAAALARGRRRRVNRVLGAVLAALALVAAMAVAGAIEDPAHGATGEAPRYTRASLFAHEWAVWRSLPATDRYYYCGMYPGYAEYVWLDGMAESEVWDAPPRMQEYVAQRVIRRGCN